MFIIGHFINAIAYILYYILHIYTFVIIARAILSWVSPDPRNPIVRFIHDITEPVLEQVRGRIPSVYGGFDLSPVIVLVIIFFIQLFIVQSLISIAKLFM